MAGAHLPTNPTVEADRTIDLRDPADLTEGRPDGAEAALVVGPGDAANIARLLELLAELPSTPGLIAEEAGYRASVVSDLLPGRTRFGGGLTAVRLERLGAVAIAGLLELLAEMPSTPPVVGDDARRLAADLWKRLAARS